jgi:hypothetical protein
MDLRYTASEAVSATNLVVNRLTLATALRIRPADL